MELFVAKLFDCMLGVFLRKRAAQENFHLCREGAFLVAAISRW